MEFCDSIACTGVHVQCMLTAETVSGGGSTHAASKAAEYLASITKPKLTHGKHHDDVEFLGRDRLDRSAFR